MAVDDLATQGARASIAMVLIQFPPNIPASSPEGFTGMPPVATFTNMD